MSNLLPHAKDTSLSDLPSGENALSAYNACRSLERKVTNEPDRIRARILGYLVLHAPSEAAQAEVVSAIQSCADDQNRLNLGECFRLWYIIPFKKHRGRTPAPSSHPSRPSFNRLREGLEIKEAPKDHRQAKAQALVRDGYKCIVSGLFDRVIWDMGKVPEGSVPATVNTECAHILPQSTYFNISNPGDKRVYAASVLAVLKHFGYDVDKVNCPKIHSLFNVMTMQRDVHDMFDRLELWFETTGAENCYRIQTAPPQGLSFIPKEVTFTSSDPENLPPPSAQLLALHAACAKVAHLSGAGRYIDKFDRDADDLDVLAADGGSHDVLTHVLEKLAVPVDTAV